MALSRSTTLKLGGVGAFLALEAGVLAFIFLGEDDSPVDTAALDGDSSSTPGGLAVGPGLPSTSETAEPTPAPRPSGVGTTAAPRPVSAATPPPVQGPKPVVRTTTPPAETAAPEPAPEPVETEEPTPAPAPPAPKPSAPTVTTPTPSSGTSYTVVRGDSLWKITKNALGAGASNNDVARSWHEVYDANRDVIGVDPNLIRPGQVLEIPAFR